MLGGQNVMEGNCFNQISQNIANIPPHYLLHITTTIYKLKVWNTDSLVIYNNDKTKPYFTYWKIGLIGGNLFGCPDSYIDKLYFYVNNSFSDSLTINYYKNNAAIFGLRDMQVTILQCPSQCYQCTGYSIAECTQCIANADINNHCNCNPGYYLESCGNKNYSSACVDSCTVCYVLCATCTNGNAQNCTACITGYQKDSNNYCVQTLSSCSPGTYNSLPFNTCVNCPIQCQNCISDIQCIDCASNYFSFQGNCYGDCPNGTYNDSSSGSCIYCHSDCLTCIGGTQNDCTACDDSSKILMSHTCYSTCPTKTYYDLATNNCLSCSASCLECLDLSDNCISCNTGLYLWDFACNTNCPQGTFGFSDYNCYMCDPTCLNCNDIYSYSCTNCTADKYFTNNSCVCNDTTFLNTTTYNCDPCDLTCLKCSGSTNQDCILCSDDMIFLGNSCYHCVDGTYLNTSSVLCDTCDQSCKTCSGISSNCTSCPVSNTLLNNSCTCIDGTFYNMSTLLCEKCDISCLTCSNNPYKCSSCSSDKILSNNTCLCPNGTYFDNANNYCQICDSNCSLCSGSSPSDCLLCINISTFLLLGRCFNSCPTGYYNDIPSKTCKNCQKNCKSCLDNTNCQICNVGYVLNSLNYCLLMIKVTAISETVQNPTAFKITFSSYWQYLMDNIDKLMNISITNLPTSNYSYKLTNDNNSCLILLTYKNSFNDSSLKLNIMITINDSNDNNSDYYLIDRTFTFPLGSYLICQSDSFYNSSN